MHPTQSNTNMARRTSVAWIVLALFLVLPSLWHCDDSLIPGESTTETTAESSPQDAGAPEQRDSGLSRPEPHGDEPPDTANETATEPTPDIPPEATAETTPEATTETPPEPALPALRAKVVSLRASFLDNQLTKGVMDRGSAPHLWSYKGTLPQGTHTLSFVLDNDATQGYGSSQNMGTLPFQGRLEANQSTSITLPRTAYGSIQVDLIKRTWQLQQENLPTSVSIQRPNAPRVAMQKQTDGSFQAIIPLSSGIVSFSFQLTFSSGTETWGQVAKQTEATFPKGGQLTQGGHAVTTTIPHPQSYRITYQPATHTFTVQPDLPDPITAWTNALKQAQNQPTPAARDTSIKGFLQRAQTTYQFPLQHQGKVLFWTEWDTKGPVYLAGSFNQWASTALPMTQLSGTHIHYLVHPLPDGRHEYKFADGNTPQQWKRDNASPGIAYNQFGPNSAIFVGTGSDSLLHLYPQSSTPFTQTRSILVYLPPGYFQTKTARFPVLYMHDGQNLFDPKGINGGWDVATTIETQVKQGNMEPVIVVGIANTPARMDEYTHTQDRISGKVLGGQAKDYARYLTKTLKPWIDGRYRTRPWRRATGTMGSSLGGLISLWLGVEHPDVFYQIGALSSTFGWGKIGANNPTMLDIVQGLTWRNLRIYIDSGSPNDNYQVTIQMRNILEQKGYIHNLNLQHWVQQGAGHNEVEWRKRLFRPMTFLFGKR
jgi:predicted alpha/beta superfamily hydrolase